MPYHGQAELKQRFVNRMLRLSRQLVQGDYGEPGRYFTGGCFVGCTLQALYDLQLVSQQECDKLDMGYHRRKLIADRLDWPEELVHTVELIFEDMDKDEAAEFVTSVCRAVRPELDITQAGQWLVEQLQVRWPAPYRAVAGYELAPWIMVADYVSDFVQADWWGQESLCELKALLIEALSLNHPARQVNHV